MQEFPPNSVKAKTRSEPPKPDERSKIEPVTTAGELRRKRSLGKKFKGAFIEGSMRMAVDSMVGEVVVPTVKDMVFQAIQTGFERMIYGESRVRRSSGPPSYSSGYSTPPRINYKDISTSNTRVPETRTISRKSRESMNFGEIVIPTRADAVEVLDQMYEILSHYESVPVATLYALTGIETTHIDHQWGWTSLKGSRVAKLRDGGYLLDLPEPIPLER